MNHHQPSPPRQPSPCATFARLAPLLDTGELDPEEEVWARDHLKGCATCQKRFAGYEIVTAAMRRHYGGMRSPVALPTAESLIRTANMEAMNDNTSVTQTLSREPLPPRAPQRRRWRPLATALTAAMVLAVIGTLFALRGHTQTTGPGAGKTPQATHASGKVVEISLGGNLPSPTSIAVDKTGSVWVLSPQNNAIGLLYVADPKAWPSYHQFQWIAPTANSGLTDLAIASDGSVWFTEASADQIGRIVPKPSTASSTGAGTVIEFGGSSITEFKDPNTAGRPFAIAPGSNGVMWFTEMNKHPGWAPFVSEIHPNGTTGNYILAIPYDAGQMSITRAPDGFIWFAEAKTGYIDRLDPAQFEHDPRNAVKRYALPNPASDPVAIAAGPDGSIWFAERGANAIGRMSPSGKVTEFPVPTPNSGLTDLAVAADGSVWFTESGANKIGHLTPASGAIQEIVVPTASAGLNSITIGPDGKVWFTETASGKIGYVTP